VVALKLWFQGSNPPETSAATKVDIVGVINQFNQATQLLDWLI
jgi:hypothetical protein